jgi:hypothetical protein
VKLTVKIVAVIRDTMSSSKVQLDKKLLSSHDFVSALAKAPSVKTEAEALQVTNPTYNNRNF